MLGYSLVKDKNIIKICIKIKALETDEKYSLDACELKHKTKRKNILSQALALLQCFRLSKSHYLHS